MKTLRITSLRACTECMAAAAVLTMALAVGYGALAHVARQALVLASAG